MRGEEEEREGDRERKAEGEEGEGESGRQQEKEDATHFVSRLLCVKRGQVVSLNSIQTLRYRDWQAVYV